uniref:Venom peptide U19-SYTX-Sth1b n=1 Tax=Scytodes thoracica TaxID=1112478 RepID=A0A0A0V6F4_SCYTH|nr:venom peptide U19-SYTX-Sth1b [Scytodes thoracica]
MDSKVAILMVLVVAFIARGTYANPSQNDFLRYLQGKSEIERDDEPTECFQRGHWCDSYGADYCCECCDLNDTCVACKSGCKRSGYKGCHSGAECCSGVCTRTLESDPYKYCVYRGHPGLGR